MKIFSVIFALSLTSFIFARKTIERGERTFDERCTGCIYDEKTDVLTCTCCRDYYGNCKKARYENASQCGSKITVGNGDLYCIDDYE